MYKGIKKGTHHLATENSPLFTKQAMFMETFRKQTLSKMMSAARDSSWWFLTGRGYWDLSLAPYVHVAVDLYTFPICACHFTCFYTRKYSQISKSGYSKVQT